MPLSPPLDRTHAETLGICAPTRCLAAWYHLVPSGPEFAAVLGPEDSAKKPSLGQTHPQSSFCCIVVKRMHLVGLCFVLLEKQDVEPYLLLCH